MTIKQPQENVAQEELEEQINYFSKLIDLQSEHELHIAERLYSLHEKWKTKRLGEKHLTFHQFWDFQFGWQKTYINRLIRWGALNAAISDKKSDVPLMPLEFTARAFAGMSCEEAVELWNSLCKKMQGIPSHKNISLARHPELQNQHESILSESTPSESSGKRKRNKNAKKEDAFIEYDEEEVEIPLLKKSQTQMDEYMVSKNSTNNNSIQESNKEEVNTHIFMICLKGEDFPKR